MMRALVSQSPPQRRVNPLRTNVFREQVLLVRSGDGIPEDKRLDLLVLQRNGALDLAAVTLVGVGQPAGAVDLGLDLDRDCPRHRLDERLPALKVLVGIVTAKRGDLYSH